ncbi:MAG: thioesterase domain-containing protein, partial [Waterburya sp.]
ARYLPDGNIEFLGRIDHQVKIRGYRIEISEIETLLHQHPDVQTAVTMVKENQTGDQRLIAYLVENKNNPRNLPQFYKTYLRQHLPEFMIPSDFIFLNSLPLSPNGKVNRRALLALDNRREQKSDLVVPRNTLELELTQIWEEILDIQPIGIEDNFFDLGGNSLLAIRLIARVEQQYEQSFSLTQLFEAPTIAQIASDFNSVINPLTQSPLVKIKSGTDKQPFFFMPGGGGVVLYLYHLAHHLDSNQAFYGLQPQGLDGEELPHAQVEEIAAYNIQALQTIQPQGPYLLGGHSFGSFVAFEMALQLQQQGQEVSFLALLDTPAPVNEGISAKEDVDDATYLVGIAKNVERLTGASLDVSHADLNLLNKDKQLDYLLQRLKNVNIFPPEANLKQLRGLLQVFKANDRAVYYPQSIYSQQITVFRAEDNHDFGDQPAMGWEQFSSVPVETHLVPGDHITMMNKPHVQTLAEKLRDCLKSQVF